MDTVRGRETSNLRSLVIGPGEVWCVEDDQATPVWLNRWGMLFGWVVIPQQESHLGGAA